MDGFKKIWKIILDNINTNYNLSTFNISLHLKYIFEENELDKNSIVSKMKITAPDGKIIILKFIDKKQRDI